VTAESTAMARSMPGMPRLKPAKPRRLSRGNPLRFRPWMRNDTWRDVLGERPVGGRIRAIRRIVTVLLLTVFAMAIQALLLLLPGPAKRVFPRLYYRAVCWLIGLRVRTIGEPSREARTLYVANHSSWLDIIVLGSRVDTCFVSKAEVGGWPVIGTIARLGRTVFVSRARGRTGAEAQDLRARLAAGDSFVLFPEGTTSDGGRVLPFRSSFLAVADAAARVQPVTVVYDRLGGLPACRRDRPLFAWYGDMDTASHAWRLLRRTGTRATVLFHGDFAPQAIPDRKAMAARIERVVAEGAAALRQNREARPAPAP
jgi:1-acyl-sn-glycerol-3-phosphate acyltransferase